MSLGAAISMSVQSITMRQLLYSVKEDGKHILFFSLDGALVMMYLNRRECRTWTKVSTMLATVAALHENNWAKCRLV